MSGGRRRSTSRLPSISLGTIGWVLLLGFIGFRVWPQLSAAVGVGGEGTPAPAFRLETLAGETVSLADLRGRVVLVNFWATWCPPCRWEMPGFQDVYDARRGDGFTIVGISTDALGRRAVAPFLEEHGITYPVALARGGVRHAFGGVSMLPTSFLIDRDGVIRYRVTGVFTEAALAQAVDRLLDETPPSSADDRDVRAPPAHGRDGGPGQRSARSARR